MSKKFAKAICFNGTIVLITGASRGIGKGLLELYLAKSNHTVVAANRNPNHTTSKALADLPKADVHLFSSSRSIARSPLTLPKL